MCVCVWRGFANLVRRSRAVALRVTRRGGSVGSPALALSRPWAPRRSPSHRPQELPALHSFERSRRSEAPQGTNDILRSAGGVAQIFGRRSLAGVPAPGQGWRAEGQTLRPCAEKIRNPFALSSVPQLPELRTPHARSCARAESCARAHLRI